VKVGGIYQLELYQFQQNSLEVNGKDIYNNDKQTLKLTLSLDDDEVIVNFINSDNISFKGTFDIFLNEIIGTVNNNEGGFGNFDLKLIK